MKPSVSISPPEARKAKRAAEVRVQRLAGNGAVEDLAAFCCVSVRSVLNWKTDGVVGYTQIGGNIWFSPDDVAELPAQYHHSGKFSKLPPGEVPDRVRRQWKEFLGCVAEDHVLRERLARIETQLGITEERMAAA